MTATVTVTNPEGNQSTVILTESSPGNMAEVEYRIASGTSRTFTVHKYKEIRVREVPWSE